MGHPREYSCAPWTFFCYGPSVGLIVLAPGRPWGIHDFVVLSHGTPMGRQNNTEPEEPNGKTKSQGKRKRYV